MTTTAYEEYISQKEWECYNRGKISEYARHHPISPMERTLLLKWLMSGHSIGSNPWDLADQAGRPLDYIEYLRKSGNACPPEPRQLLGEVGVQGQSPASFLEGGVNQWSGLPMYNKVPTRNR